MRRSWALTGRERAELTVTALVPAAAPLLGEWARQGGRLAWLLPLAALPVGLLLRRAWLSLGREGLAAALNRPGRGWLRVLYLLWGLVLLGDSARSCGRRLLASAGQSVGLLPALGAGLLLTAWLGRNRGRYVRTGRIFYLTTVVTLGAVGLLALPSVHWENLLPMKAQAEGLAGGVLSVLSLAGYGVYGLMLARRGEPVGRGWAVAGTVGVSAILLVTLGAFGPVLAGRLDQPFIYILKGVGVPGAFQRGEAILAAVLSLADLVLLGILAKGCTELLPDREWARWAVIGVGALLAWGAEMAGEHAKWAETWIMWVNLTVGIGIPVIMAWMTKESPTIYGGGRR